MRRRDDSVALDRDERRTLSHPRIDDELTGLALELAKQAGDRDGAPGHDGGDVGVDEPGQLLAIGTTKRTHLE